MMMMMMITRDTFNVVLFCVICVFCRLVVLVGLCKWLTGKTRLRNDLKCIDGDVKLNSLTQYSLSQVLTFSAVEGKRHTYVWWQVTTSGVELFQLCPKTTTTFQRAIITRSLAVCTRLIRYSSAISMNETGASDSRMNGTSTTEQRQVAGWLAMREASAVTPRASALSDATTRIAIEHRCVVWPRQWPSHFTAPLWALIYLTL